MKDSRGLIVSVSFRNGLPRRPLKFYSGLMEIALGKPAGSNSPHPGSALGEY